MWANAHSPSPPDRRSSLSGQEALPREPVEDLVERLVLATERRRPEDLAHDRGILEDRLLARREVVEAGGDDALDGLGHRQVARSSLARGRARRTAPRRTGCPRPDRAAPAGPRPAARCRLSTWPMSPAVCHGGERRQPDRRGVELAAAPAWATLEQLRPGGPDDEQRDVGQPVHELVDEVEETGVGPVEILEHQDQRDAARPAPRGSVARRRTPRHGGRRRGRSPSRGRPADEDATRPMLGQPALRRRRRSRLGASSRGLRLGVPLVDAGLGLDHLAERPVGDPVAVGETAPLAPGDELRIGVDDASELVDQPALAHSRDADQRDELRGSLGRRPLEGVPQRWHLALAPDELGPGVVVDVDAEARSSLDSLPGRDRARPCPWPRPPGPRGTRSARGSLGGSSRRRGSRSRARRACRRAAVLTTSPEAIPSPSAGRASSETSASPVVIPTRSSSPSSMA